MGRRGTGRRSAVAAGLHASRPDGSPLVYNQPAEHGAGIVGVHGRAAFLARQHGRRGPAGLAVRDLRSPNSLDGLLVFHVTVLALERAARRGRVQCVDRGGSPFASTRAHPAQTTTSGGLPWEIFVQRALGCHPEVF